MPKNIVAKATFIAIACSLAMSAHAVADSPRNLNVPAGDLIAALKSLATQSDVQLMYQPEQLRDFQTEGVKGEYSPQQAVAILLKGTSLHVRTDSSGAMVIVPAVAHGTGTSSGAAVDRAPTESSPAEKRSFWDRFRVAQVDPGKTSEADPERASHAPVKLEEIVVTATKREERLQDIPMSIAVIGNQDIERRGLIGMEDYLRSIPGVNQIDNGSQSNAIVIRGITTAPQFENFNAGATVASYFGETPITAATGPNTGGIDVRPVDIERIEVLRGPQGTTFGDAAIGGAVRIIPMKPSLNGFDAKAAVSFSQTGRLGSDDSMVQGVLNVPLVDDKLAVRAVGYRYDESGYYRNVGGTDPATLAKAANFGLASFVAGHEQDDVGRMVTVGGRLSALWKLTDAADLSLSYLKQKIEQDGLPQVTVGDYDQTRMPIAPQARVRGEDGEAVDTDLDLGNATFNYDLAWASLTATASWVDGGSLYATDASASFAFPLSTRGPSDFNSFTSETRLASKLDGPLQFLGGLFYQKIREEGASIGEWPGTPATSPNGTNPYSVFDFKRHIEQRAAFGEVSYRLTERLTATAGGRYFDYDKDQSTLSEGGTVPIGSGVPAVLRKGENGTTFKANLNYKITGDSLAYASWSQGFRLGRPSAAVPPALCDTNNDGVIDGSTTTVDSTSIVDSDTLNNYEIGGKAALFGNRVTLDMAVYHIDWNDIPARVAPNGSNLCRYVTNAGKATSNGVEFQASLLPTAGLRIDLGAGYTDAELSQDVPAQGWSKGDRLPGSPKFSANLAAQYDFDLAGHKAFVRADSFYTGKFYGDVLQSPLTQAGDYIKVDARAGVMIKSLSLELFARNLTNEDSFTWRGLANANSAFGYRLRPRTVGIQLGYEFR
jgi:outer membrane receptor protein involved in Fe transport